MAVSSTYCTHRDVKDVFPGISEFDNKIPIYGFTKDSALNNWQDDSIDAYYAHGVGLCTELFFNGVKLTKREYSSTVKTTLNGAIDADDGGCNFTSGSPFGVDDLVKINNEYMVITGVSTNSIVFTRGILGTPNTAHSDSASVYLQYDSSAYDLAPSSSDAVSFLYDPDIDMLALFTQSVDPNDNLVESGEDYKTLITRITKNASRYFDSRVDASLPRDQWKDKEGNYDYLIVRTTALISAVFLLKSQDPLNPMIDKFEEEYNNNIALMNSGQAKLSHQNSADSSKGMLRDVSYTDNSIRPIDTRGNWHGTYDIIKIKITTGGVLGTATYSVWTKDGDKLGINEGTQVVTDEKINGDYQALAGGLQIRFAGSTKDSVATITNEWELEVFGSGEEVENPVVRSVKMTRGWKTNRFRG